ncbi:MAG TPA: hypothetical protein DDX91_08540 [Ruminococcaceae bacterium]|nr:hypothetical protein [Oscillospiraceae bacterium]
MPVYTRFPESRSDLCPLSGKPAAICRFEIIQNSENENQLCIAALPFIFRNFLKLCFKAAVPYCRKKRSKHTRIFGTI